MSTVTRKFVNGYLKKIFLAIFANFKMFIELKSSRFNTNFKLAYACFFV